MENFNIDSSCEALARNALRDLLKSQNKAIIENRLNELLSLNEHFVGQFEYFNHYLTEFHKENLLVSGSSAGSEMLIAKNFGFKEVNGVEVSQDLVKIASLRLSYDTSMHVDFYEGQILPYEDCSFSMITSSHVIEHTPDPFKYIAEHLRVLKIGGLFFIELPSRYWFVELHSGLISYEYLPLPFRNFVLKKLGKRLAGYHAILNELMPVSAWQVVFYCAKSKYKFRIRKYSPIRHGFSRLVIEKRDISPDQ